MEDRQQDGPAKRRKLSRTEHNPPTSLRSPVTRSSGHDVLRRREATTANGDEERKGMSTPAISKQAEQTVASFLAKHIPEQYAPAGNARSTGDEDLPRSRLHDPNTKYCYRHQPDLKCRRQVDEPSMDELQRELENLGQGDKQAIAHVWSIFSASTSQERKLILQGILAQCCFSQLSYLSTSVRDLIRIDFLSALPAEISYRILCFLDTASLCRAAQVSRRWRLLADDDVVWHRMCEQHIDRKCIKCGWGLPLLERKRLRATKRQMQLRATGRGLNEWSPDITPDPENVLHSSHLHSQAEHIAYSSAGECSPKQDYLSARPQIRESDRPRTRPWKEVYKDRFKVGTNWKYGRCDVKIFRGHQNGVMCLQFDDQILASGSYDTTIKIWDIRSGEELRTLRGHTSAVRCLQFDDTKLISGSLDSTIRIWNWRTGECLSALTAVNSGGIIGLHFDSSILATGSADGTVRIWNFDDKSATVMRGHTDWVNSVKIDSASRTVFSASDDGTVKIWDLDGKVCVKTLEGHVGQVQQVVLLPRDVEFDDEGVQEDRAAEEEHTHDHLPVVPLEPGAPFPLSRAPSPTLSTHSLASNHSTSFPTFDSARPLPPRYIITGALDSTIRLWDTHTSRPLQTYFGHVEGVWAVAADTLRVVSGAQDRTVKVWDLRREGRCERTFGGHAAPVTCIGLSDEMMASGGEDCEVRLYSF